MLDDLAQYKDGLGFANHFGTASASQHLNAACCLAVQMRRRRFGDLPLLQAGLAPSGSRSLDLVTVARVVLRLAANRNQVGQPPPSVEQRDSPSTIAIETNQPVAITLLAWAYRFRREIREAIAMWTERNGMADDFAERYFGRSNDHRKWERQLNRSLPRDLDAHDFAFDLTIFLASRFGESFPPVLPKFKGQAAKTPQANSHRISWLTLSLGVQYGILATVGPASHDAGSSTFEGPIP
jgi:hypothetical protein